MVIDELIVRNGTTNLPIDSYDNQMIDEIVYEGNTYHFAKQKDLVGETSIIANNAVQEPMVSLELQGNTEQQTYEGYNLYDISKVNGAANSSTPNPSVAGDAQFGTVTDGVLHLKYGMYANGVVWTGSKIPIKQGGAYYVSADIFIDSSIVATHTRMNVLFKNYTKGTTTGWYFFYNTDARDTWFNCNFNGVAVPDDWVGDDVYLVLQPFGDKTQYSDLPVYAKNIMISYNEAKPYEPYVGGIASPNPEYPQEIKSSGNDGLSATIKGANLFALGESNYTVGKVYTNAGITYTVQADGGIHCKGTKTSSYSYFIFMSGASLRKYGQGTYSLGVYGENIPSKITIEFRRLDANGVSVQTGKASVGVPVTRTLAEGETLERFSVLVSTEGEVDFVVYPMLNIGNPLPYEPYFHNTIEIPPSVTLADGTVVDLRFAKYKNADYLLMEKGKVKYFAYSTEGDPTKPLSEQMENIPPIEYDLTNTELGARLLEWARTGKGTNIVEVTSELPVSQTKMSYWRQIIPNE